MGDGLSKKGQCCMQKYKVVKTHAVLGKYVKLVKHMAGKVKRARLGEYVNVVLKNFWFGFRRE